MKFGRNHCTIHSPWFNLSLPLSLSLQISDEGVEEEEDEDRENDVEELLEKLKDVTELFDCKNEVYLEMEKKSEAMKIVKQTNK